MSKSLKWILTVLLVAVVFVGVYFLYDYLQGQVGSNQFSQPQTADSEKPSGNEEPQSGVESNNSNNNSDSDSGTADTKAPDFTVLDENGKEVKLSDFFGKPIVLNFWASWCYFCKEEMPDFNEAFHNNPDIQFLMINVTDNQRETMESAKKFIGETGYEFPVLYDVQLIAAGSYGASGLPTTYFIDKDGNLVTYATGMLSKENLLKGIEMIK